MRVKIDIKRLVNTSYNVILTAVLGEIVNGGIKTIKRKMNSIRRKEKEEAE